MECYGKAKRERERERGERKKVKMKVWWKQRNGGRKGLEFIFLV